MKMIIMIEELLFEFIGMIANSKLLGGVRMAKIIAKIFGYEMPKTFWVKR